MTKNAPARYHPSQVTFHWLTVILLFAMFPLGTYMSRLPNDAGKIALLTVHTILGSMILIIIIARFINRFRLPRPTHATAGNVFLDWIGKVVHYLLYMLVFLMAVSGISLSLQAGLLPIIFGGSGVALPADFYVFVTRMLHGVIAPMLALLIVLHIGAALYHQFLLKDNLLSRMWYKRK
jgi:cytochrome b561